MRKQALYMYSPTHPQKSSIYIPKNLVYSQSCISTKNLCKQALRIDRMVYSQNCPYPQKSPVHPQKNPVYLQKSPVYPQKTTAGMPHNIPHVRALYICKRALPCVSAKDPCISAKKPCISPERYFRRRFAGAALKASVVREREGGAGGVEGNTASLSVRKSCYFI